MFLKGEYVMGNGNIIIKPKPPKGEDGYHTFAVRIKREVVEQLDEICAKTGYNRNELVGLFLKYGLEHFEINDSEE